MASVNKASAGLGEKQRENISQLHPSLIISKDIFGIQKPNYGNFTKKIKEENEQKQIPFSK